MTVTACDGYDFELKKLILKPDPSHPSQKLTTVMYAFSETSWELKTMLYFERGIPNLKEKDWEKIIDAVAEYSNVFKPPKLAAPKGKRSFTTQEEEELVWDSDSD